MRWIGIGLVVLSLLTGCAPGRPGATDSPQPAIESQEVVDPTPLNEQIARAVAAGAEWPESPLRITVELLGSEGNTRALSIDEERNVGGGADTMVVVMVRDGFHDDSIRGDWHRVVYGREPDGTWRVARVTRAFRCYRGHHLDTFSSQWCP
jgi:hypothetical protein